MEEKYIEKNILFVGKSRVGKTTIVNVLQNANYIPPFATIYRQTVEPSFHQFILQNKIKLNFIDTPGFFEIAKENQKRDNNQIQDLIFSSIVEKYESIDFVMIVFSIKDGLKEEDLLSLELLIDLFKENQENIKFLITRSEDSSEEEREKSLKELSNHPKIKKMGITVSKSSCFFIGSISPEKNEQGFVEEIEFEKQNISEMRNLLIDLFSKETKNRINFGNTPFFKKYLEKYLEDHKKASSTNYQLQNWKKICSSKNEKSKDLFLNQVDQLEKQFESEKRQVNENPFRKKLPSLLNKFDFLKQNLENLILYPQFDDQQLKLADQIIILKEENEKLKEKTEKYQSLEEENKQIKQEKKELTNKFNQYEYKIRLHEEEMKQVKLKSEQEKRGLIEKNFQYEYKIRSVEEEMKKVKQKSEQEKKVLIEKNNQYEYKIRLLEEEKKDIIEAEQKAKAFEIEELKKLKDQERDNQIEKERGEKKFINYFSVGCAFFNLFFVLPLVLNKN